jgi:hypothetical protein
MPIKRRVKIGKVLGQGLRRQAVRGNTGRKGAVSHGGTPYENYSSTLAQMKILSIGKFFEFDDF